MEKSNFSKNVCVSICLSAVSYTHLDVYKRQVLYCGSLTVDPCQSISPQAVKMGTDGVAETFALDNIGPRTDSLVNNNINNFEAFVSQYMR